MRSHKIEIDQEHMALLDAMAELLTLEDTFGAVPEFNAKRPFGNSSQYVIACDAWQICGGHRDDEDITGDSIDAERNREHMLGKIKECVPILHYLLTKVKEVDDALIGTTIKVSRGEYADTYETEAT